MIKKILYTLLFCFSFFLVKAQPKQTIGNTNNIVVANNLLTADSGFVLTNINDTSVANLQRYLKNLRGAIFYSASDSSVYVRRGHYWVKMATGFFVDSITVNGTTICSWQNGSPTCYAVTNNNNGTTDGVDSVTATTTAICQWKNGVPTCYAIIGNGIDSVTIRNDLFCQWANGDSVCYDINGDVLGSGLDSVTVAGNILCQWSGGSSTCFYINNGGQYADSIGLNADSTLYLLFNNGNQLGSGVSTLQKPLIGVGRMLVRDTTDNALAIYWDSAGFSTNVDLQTVINYTAATTNPNNNAVADAVEGGYIGLKNKDDQNGFYTFSETHPLSKLSLLGVYDSVAQQVTSGFYGQGAQINILAPVGMTINSDVDSAGIVLQTRFSNTELPTDSLLAINTNGELKKRAVPSGSSQWITSGSDIYYNTGNVGIGTATLGNYRLSVNASGTDGILIDSAASFNVNGNTIGGESYIFGSENSISLSTKNAAETNLLTRIGIDGTLDIANVSILNANLIINAGALRLPSYTVATLPSGVEGDLVYITDGDAGLVWNDIAVGGGSVKLMAFYDGANWRVR